MFHLLAQIGTIFLVVIVFVLLARHLVWSLRLPSDHALIQAWCQEHGLHFLGSKRHWSRLHPISNPFALRLNIFDGVYYVAARNPTGQPADFWALYRRSPLKNFVPELRVEPAHGSVQG